jgi:hypothetical protein
VLNTTTDSNNALDVGNHLAPPSSPDGLSSPETVPKAWQLAIDEYSRDLSPTDADIFQTATLDSLLLEFRVIEELHRSSSTSLRWAARFQPLVKTLEAMSDAMGIFVQAHPLPMALIWGSVVLAMKMFNSWVAGFEHILEIFERINDNLPRFQR